MLEKSPNQPIPAPANGVPADVLSELLSTFSMLRSNSQNLLDEIRCSITEMRQLRLRLQEQSPGPTGNSSNNSGDLHDRYALTRREVQVAQLLARGLSNSGIAEELRISRHTARHHTQSILSKLGVHSRAAAGAKIRD